jgi:hypothetical protein
MSPGARHHLKTLHPILLPAGLLFAASVALLATTKEAEARIMLVQMSTSFAVLVSVWLLLRQYIDTLIMASKGFDEKFGRLERDISEVRQLPAIQRALARQRAGGPEDTQPPVQAPKFNP